MSSPQSRRKAHLQERDGRIFLHLFWVDRMTAEQVKGLEFPNAGVDRTKNRLWELARKRYLKSEVRRTGGEGNNVITLFSLEKKTRAAVAQDLLYEHGLDKRRLFGLWESDPTAEWRQSPYNQETSGLDELDASKAYHLERVSDTYARLAPSLDRHVGRAGVHWLWRNERRAARPYTRHATSHWYLPDAELVLEFPREVGDPAAPGPEPYHLFIEYQTEASKKTSREIAEKVETHALASTRPGFPEVGRRVLVFAAEDHDHAEAAVRAATRLGVPILAGHPDEILKALRSVFADVGAGVRPNLGEAAGAGRRPSPQGTTAELEADDAEPPTTVSSGPESRGSEDPSERGVARDGETLSPPAFATPGS